MSNVPILSYTAKPQYVSFDMADANTGSDPRTPIYVNSLGRFYSDRHNFQLSWRLRSWRRRRSSQSPTTFALPRESKRRRRYEQLPGSAARTACLRRRPMTTIDIYVKTVSVDRQMR